MSDKPNDPPTIHYWLGRRLEDLSKEELMAAVIELGAWNNTLVAGAQADRKMFGRIIKDAARALR